MKTLLGGTCLTRKNVLMTRSTGYTNEKAQTAVVSKHAKLDPYLDLISSLKVWNPYRCSPTPFLPIRFFHRRPSSRIGDFNHA